MQKKITKSFRIIYQRIISSIAFYPLLIAIGFMGLFWLILLLDHSAWGSSIKSQVEWIRLKDSQTARIIASTIAAAILSLTVFSFSIVMIILNQAASQISNRTLDSMVENRFQQIVLGIYLGTIVYALLILSTIRSSDSYTSIPALSIYFLILLTVVDIFLFIYFLHFATQTVKYGTIINRIHKQTADSMMKLLDEKKENYEDPENFKYEIKIASPESGYFQGFGQDPLIRLAEKKNVVLKFLYPVGTYILKNIPFLVVLSKEQLAEEKKSKEEILSNIDFYLAQLPQHHFYFGFLHLTEIAVKSLSPGINDPSTAVLSLNSLSDLFALMMNLHPSNVLKDKKENVRILRREWTFEDLFHKCIEPICHYGEKDLFIREALNSMLSQLSALDETQQYHSLFKKFNPVQNRVPEMT